MAEPSTRREAEEPEEKVDVFEEEAPSPFRKIHSRIYEAEPTADMSSKEFQYCCWFLDDKWRMIVEPPQGRRGGKTRGYVLPLRDVAKKKTVGKGDAKDEVIVIEGFFFNPDLYKHWDKQKIWNNNQNVEATLSKTKKTCENYKSKSILTFCQLTFS